MIATLLMTALYGIGWPNNPPLPVRAVPFALMTCVGSHSAALEIEETAFITAAGQRSFSPRGNQQPCTFTYPRRETILKEVRRRPQVKKLVPNGLRTSVIANDMRKHGRFVRYPSTS